MGRGPAENRTGAFLDPGAVGSLEVVVEGLPSGASADVTVIGAMGFVEYLR